MWCRFIIFALLLWLVKLERNRMLLSARTIGHSNSMVAIWGITCALEVANVMSWNSMEWWFHRSNKNEQVDRIKA